MALENIQFHARGVEDTDDERSQVFQNTLHLEYGRYITNMKFGIESPNLTDSQQDNIRSALSQFNCLLIECLRFNDEQGLDYVSLLLVASENWRSLLSSLAEQVEAVQAIKS